MKFLAAITAGAALVSLSACSVSGNSSNQPSSSASKVITLVTHDDWTPNADVMAGFTKRTGYTVKVIKEGDAGALANKLVLTKGDPQGDVVFGIDNTFASRVAQAGVLESYTSPAMPKSAASFELPAGQGRGQLSPTDYGNVCVNVDDAWFTKHKLAKPATFDDLTKAQYKTLMVTEGASTSAPGFSFFLATIAKYGENGWKTYWSALLKNGVKIDSGWDDAWNVDYTAASKTGTRPIVVSYDTSTAATLDKAGRTTTSSMTSTCFHSGEYAGVLKGANNQAGAKAFIDFLYSDAFQASFPDAMYSLPVDSGVTLPKQWSDNVTIAKNPLNIAPATIDTNRQKWLTQWQDVTSR